jgi:flagellar biogenesis protein FliO
MVGILAVTALIVRKARGGAIQPLRHAKLPAFAAQLTKKFVGTQRGPKAQVDVLATHHLGPKKSLSVVKIAGRTLVLGVTDESINLITQLDDDVTPEEAILDALAHKSNGAATLPPTTMGSGAVAAGPALFSDVFQIEKERPQIQNPKQPSKLQSARERIKNRLSGMKELG